MANNRELSVDNNSEKQLDQEYSQSGHSLELPLTNTSSLSPDDTFPEGGLQGWLQVLCSFILFFNSWGIVNSFGVFQSHYTTTELANPSAISWIGSSQAFLLLFVGVITGPLFDAGYFYHLIWLGSFLSVFGMMMTSLGTQYYQIILAQGICVGLGSGSLFMPSITTIPQYFLKRRALAQGIGAAGSSIGGIIYPIVFYQLEPRIGFAWATRVMGFILLATQAVVLAVMRTRATPGPMRKLWDMTAFKEPPFDTYTAGMFLALMGTYIPFFYISEYTLQVPGATPALSFYMVSIMNAGSVFGRVVPNFIADYAGPLNVMAPSAFITGLLAYCWIRIHNIGGLVVFGALYGFFSGSIVSLPPTVMTSLTPRLDLLGTRMGTIFTISSFGLLIGTPCAGAILGNGSSYVGAQAFGASAVVAASILYGATRVLHKGFKFRIKA